MMRESRKQQRRKYGTWESFWSLSSRFFWGMEKVYSRIPRADDELNNKKICEYTQLQLQS